MPRTVRDLIHAVDPYLYFDENALPYDLQGWGGHPEFFSELVFSADVTRALEVGSWKGRSAAAIAGAMWSFHCHSGSPKPELVCVDTWLGATEFYDRFDDETRYGSLRMQNGYPQVYYQFLTNMRRRSLHDIVTPFAQTSTNALRFLAKKDVQFDLIYIDGSHEYDDVMTDLMYAWPLLRKGGIMVGDDYCEHWAGVMAAVDRFFMGKEPVEHRQYPGEKYPSDYWIVRKA